MRYEVKTMVMCPHYLTNTVEADSMDQLVRLLHDDAENGRGNLFAAPDDAQWAEDQRIVEIRDEDGDMLVEDIDMSLDSDRGTLMPLNIVLDEVKENQGEQDDK